MTSRPSPAIPAAIELRAALTRLNRQLRGIATIHGPGAAKFSVLGQLYRGGELTPTVLAQRERVKLQSLTRLLAELEADGCIERSPHEHDGRQSVLRLTRHGAALLTAEVHRREHSLAEAIAGELSAPEQAQLRRACGLLDRVADAMEQAAAPPVPPARKSASRTSA